MTAQKLFTQDDVEQILRVVDGLSDVEVRLEVGDLKLHVRKFSGAGVASTTLKTDTLPESQRATMGSAGAAQATSTPVGSPSGVEPPLGAVAIRAPMLGTFYRAPSPAEPAFVDEGSRVRRGDPVCIIEVMKLFNTVNAEVDGTVVAIVAENGQMVDQDDVLFYVKAAA